LTDEREAAVASKEIRHAHPANLLSSFKRLPCTILMSLEIKEEKKYWFCGILFAYYFLGKSSVY
jgi:hypothetical protein